MVIDIYVFLISGQCKRAFCISQLWISLFCYFTRLGQGEQRRSRRPIFILTHTHTQGTTSTGYTAPWWLPFAQERPADSITQVSTKLPTPTSNNPSSWSVHASLQPTFFMVSSLVDPAKRPYHHGRDRRDYRICASPFEAVSLFAAEGGVGREGGGGRNEGYEKSLALAHLSLVCLCPDGLGCWILDVCVFPLGWRRAKHLPTQAKEPQKRKEQKTTRRTPPCREGREGEKALCLAASA